MAQVIITINYREYAISCDNGQEIQIMKLGRMLDEKAKSLISRVILSSTKLSGISIVNGILKLNGVTLALTSWLL